MNITQMNLNKKKINTFFLYQNVTFEFFWVKLLVNVSRMHHQYNKFQPRET